MRRFYGKINLQNAEVFCDDSDTPARTRKKLENKLLKLLVLYLLLLRNLSSRVHLDRHLLKSVGDFLLHFNDLSIFIVEEQFLRYF